LEITNGKPATDDTMAPKEDAPRKREGTGVRGKKNEPTASGDDDDDDDDDDDEPLPH